MKKDMGMNGRILVVDNTLSITGGFKAIAQSSYDLHNDFEFVFVLPKDSLLKPELNKLGFRCYCIPFKEIKLKFVNILLYLPYLLINSIRLWRIVRKEKIEIIHSNDLYNLAVLIPKIFSKAKLFVHIRLMPASMPKVLYSTWIFLHKIFADKLICVSEAVCTTLNSKKAIVVYDRPPQAENLPYSYKGRNSENKISIIYMANYIRGKGQDVAVEVFHKISKKRDDVVLSFAGGDMGLEKNRLFKESLRQRVNELGLGERVYFLDFISDVEQEYKKHQIALNFSGSESFSLTCLEASFYGIPLVATDSGGPSEIIENGKTGFIVKKDDEAGLVAATFSLIENENQRVQFSESGRKYVREKFSFEQTSRKLKELYTEFLRK